jgi:hypothetical protein
MANTVTSSSTGFPFCIPGQHAMAASSSLTLPALCPKAGQRRKPQPGLWLPLKVTVATAGRWKSERPPGGALLTAKVSPPGQGIRRRPAGAARQRPSPLPHGGTGTGGCAGALRVTEAGTRRGSPAPPAREAGPRPSRVCPSPATFLQNTSPGCTWASLGSKSCKVLSMTN